jgi:hypothetical protein
VSQRFLRICLFILVFALPGSLLADQPAVGPRIAFEAETVQMGQILRGESVEAEFVYRNEGDSPLRILRAKPG